MMVPSPDTGGELTESVRFSKERCTHENPRSRAGQAVPVAEVIKMIEDTDTVTRRVKGLDSKPVTEELNDCSIVRDDRTTQTP